MQIYGIKRCEKLKISEMFLEQFDALIRPSGSGFGYVAILGQTSQVLKTCEVYARHFLTLIIFIKTMIYAYHADCNFVTRNRNLPFHEVAQIRESAKRS